MDESINPPWSELPQDLLAIIFGRIFSPADRACIQSVCRSWHSVACPAPRQLPWIMLPSGGFLNPSDRVMRRHTSFHKTSASCRGSTDYHNPRFFSFPKTTRCVGSTDGWITIDCADAKNRHTYFLHNEFSSTTLPLPELDTAIGQVSKLFRIRKVLLRSTPDDVIAVRTNHDRCPIILTQRGKGVWFPNWHAAPGVDITDFVFTGDRLCGITQAEDLFFLDIAYDNSGVPTVTNGECVIGNFVDVWSKEEDYDNNYNDNDDVAAANDDGDGDDHDERDDYVDDSYDLTKMTKHNVIYDEAWQVGKIYEPMINTMWFLVESRGKLIMVRRQVIEPWSQGSSSTHKVEVFEADISAAKWVPLEGGLGGQALFISTPFSRSISSACSKEIQEDAIYFIDTDEVFYMRSKTVSAPRDDWDYPMNLRNGDTKELTWVFPPELVA